MASTTSPGSRSRPSWTCSDFEGMRPIELTGGVEFPRIGELPYLLTLAPYGFYWLRHAERGLMTRGEMSPGQLNPDRRRRDSRLPRQVSMVRQQGLAVRRDRASRSSAELRPGRGAVAPPGGRRRGTVETYHLAVEPRDVPAENLGSRAHRTGTTATWYYDALFDRDTNASVARPARGTASSQHLRTYRVGSAALPQERQGRVMTAEQSNTSLVYGSRWCSRCSAARRVGINPDVEVHAALARDRQHPHRAAFRLDRDGVRRRRLRPGVPRRRRGGLGARHQQRARPAARGRPVRRGGRR